MSTLFDDSISEGSYKERTLSSTHNSDLDRYSIPLLQKKILQRSCRGPISIKRVDPKGEYIVIENTSIKKPVVMTNWTLRRRGVDVPQNTFKFDKHFVLHPNKSVKIYAKDKCQGNAQHELKSETIKTWGVGTYAFTQICNHLNQEKASLLEKVEHYERDLHLSGGGSGGIAINGNRNNNSSQSSLNEFRFNNKDIHQTYSNIGEDKQFEFYFEKNIRP